MFRTFVIAGADDVWDIYHCWCCWCLGHVLLLVLMLFRACVIAGVDDVQDTVIVAGADDVQGMCHCWCWWCSGHMATVRGAWLEDVSAGGSRNNLDLFATNPQFLLTLHEAGQWPLRPCWLLTDWLWLTNLTHCLHCTRLSVAPKALLVTDWLVMTHKLNPLLTLHKAGQWPLRPCWLLTDWLLHTNLTHCLHCTRLDSGP